MALTYSETGIADADFAVLKPIKGSQAILLRDNPKASRKYVRRSADSAAVNNSTALVDDGVLEFSADASQGYAITICGRHSGASNSGIKFALDVPAGATLTMTVQCIADETGTNPGDAWSGFSVADDTAVGAVGPGGGLEYYIFHIQAFVLTDSAGDIKLRFAQQAAVGSDTKILAGSFLIYHRVDSIT
jgi:hypothetical protein